MGIRRALFFISTVLFFAITLLIVTIKIDKDRSSAYFKNLNLELAGIVTDKKVVTNGAGLLYVDVRSTSIKDYDIRASNRYYYCVIHDRKAEISEGGLFEIHIGDSILADSKIDSFKCFRNGKLILQKRLSLTYFPPVLEGIKKIHRL
jgi:hypothetical protein